VADSGFAAPAHAAPAQSASGRGAARAGARSHGTGHASPDFATIYAFIGTLFDPVRARAAARRGPPRPARARRARDYPIYYGSEVGGRAAQACEQVDHAGVLAQMPPVDRETAGLLMHNIIANLACPPALAEHLRVLRLAPHAPGQRL
jgi:hypothetical protein